MNLLDQAKGKVIDLTVRAAPVRWTIQVGDNEDCIQCRYKPEGAVARVPHWSVFIMASTIDRAQVLIEEAKVQLARSMAAGKVEAGRG